MTLAKKILMALSEDKLSKALRLLNEMSPDKLFQQAVLGMQWYVGILPPGPDKSECEQELRALIKGGPTKFDADAMSEVAHHLYAALDKLSGTDRADRDIWTVRKMAEIATDLFSALGKEEDLNSWFAGLDDENPLEMKAAELEGQISGKYASLLKDVDGFGRDVNARDRKTGVTLLAGSVGIIESVEYKEDRGTIEAWVTHFTEENFQRKQTRDHDNYKIKYRREWIKDSENSGHYEESQGIPDNWPNSWVVEAESGQFWNKWTDVNSHMNSTFFPPPSDYVGAWIPIEDLKIED